MLTAKDIMIQDVFTVHQNDLVQTVVEKFAQHRISGMPIVDDHDHLVGYISDGDIMRFLGKYLNKDFATWGSMVGYYYGLNMGVFNDPAASPEEVDEFKENALKLCRMNVLEVGVKRIITIGENEDLVHVANLLAKKKIKKVPVAQDNKLIGIISRGDIVRAMVQKFVLS